MAAVPDAVRGDEVLACIVTAEGIQVDTADAREKTAHDIVKWALSQLAYYKAPGYVAFVDALPLTATNKIQRGELKKLAPTLPDAPECVNTCHMKKRQEPA